MLIVNSKKIIYIVKWIALSIIFLILQLLIMPHFAYQSSVPNILVTMIIVSALLFGLKIAFPLGLCLAFLQQGFLYDNLFFLSWILLPFFAVFTYPHQLGFHKNIIRFLQVMLCTFYAEIINAFSYSAGSEKFAGFSLALLPDDIYHILLFNPLLNGILAIPVLWGLDKLFPNENRL
jgi:hypothetical protein